MPKFPFKLLVRMNSTDSKAWMHRHVNDIYVKHAEKENLRSRAAFKLIEVQEKHKIIRPSDFVIDLGASPGGWSVVASKILDFTTGGKLISVDLLPMETVKDSNMIVGDFNSHSTIESIDSISNSRLANVILSDMLQNTTGHASTDHFKSMNICSDVLEFSHKYLSVGGHLLCKFYRGQDDGELIANIKEHFKLVKLIKPKSSRTESREMYLLALDRKTVIH